METMRILIYKRTHTGDPNKNGRFGINNCMGRVRSFNYEAVIGVGGIGQEPKQNKIDRRINWVGIGPIKTPNSSTIEFKEFILLEHEGPLLEEIAPTLAKRVFERNARFILHDYNASEKQEINKILSWAKTHTPKIYTTSPPSSKPECSTKCNSLKKIKCRPLECKKPNNKNNDNQKLHKPI